jgi:hypothetical protein
VSSSLLGTAQNLSDGHEGCCNLLEYEEDIYLKELVEAQFKGSAFIMCSSIWLLENRIDHYVVLVSINH